MTLKEEMRKRDAEIKKYQEWEDTEGRYKFTELAMGSKAYAYVPADGDDTIPHYLCPQCFAKKQKSFLQGAGTLKRGYLVLRCPVCGTEAFDETDGYVF